MSADNTILVLGTRRPETKNEMEYRVAIVQGEDLFVRPDYPSPTNAAFSREDACRIFAGVRVFYDRGAAMMEAARLHDMAVYVEYGIKLYDYPGVFFPASEGRRRQRAHAREHKRRRIAAAASAPPLRPEAPAAPASPAS